MASIVEYLKGANINSYRYVRFWGVLLLLVILISAMVVCLLMPAITVSSAAEGLSEPFSLLADPQRMPQLTAITPTSSVSSAQSSQGQQINDNTIANDTITAAGVFAAVIGVILGVLTLAAAIATGFGILEVRRISRFRKQFDAQLEQLDKRIDTESQKYMEASYYYSEGTKAYRAGDNKHAIENYLAALRYLPKSPRVLERIGRAYSNLNEKEKAYEYLKQAIDIDPYYEPTLRSLALYYRYSNNQEAIRILKQILEKNPFAYESWDFLGLCYRDQLQQGQLLSKNQEIIDKAIDAHEKARNIKERPETEFYLGILLFFSPVGDKNRARDLLISASKRVEEQEHDVRIRDVWKKLIQAGAPIVEGKQAEALQCIADVLQYKPSQRIYIGVESHLRFLLEGSGRSDWIQTFMDKLSTWKES